MDEYQRWLMQAAFTDVSHLMAPPETEEDED